MNVLDNIFPFKSACMNDKWDVNIYSNLTIDDVNEYYHLCFEESCGVLFCIFIKLGRQYETSDGLSWVLDFTISLVVCSCHCRLAEISVNVGGGYRLESGSLRREQISPDMCQRVSVMADFSQSILDAFGFCPPIPKPSWGITEILRIMRVFPRIWCLRLASAGATTCLVCD